MSTTAPLPPDDPARELAIARSGDEALLHLAVVGDTYTVLLSGSAVLAINQTLYKKPLYNAVTDFAHVALFSDSARVLIARKDLPANTLAEFVAYAKANQARMQYGSAGAGSGMHVCAVLLNAAMGTGITHVP